MDENTLAKTLEDLAAKDAALVAQEQTAETLQERAELLKRINEAMISATQKS